MFSVTDIQTGFGSLIGWRDTLDTGLPRLKSTLTTSNSGMYFNDAHPLVSVETIDSCGFNIDGVSNATYDASTTYSKDQAVRYNGVTYSSLADTNKGHTPSTSTTWWVAQINTVIENITKTSIVNMINRVIIEKQLTGATKSTMQDVKLFDGEGRIRSTIVGQGRFVGFEFKVKNYTGLQLAVRQVGAQFSLAQTNLTIYLFHSSQDTAVKTYSLTSTKNYSTEWFEPIDFTMNFCKYTKNDAGGAWYIGYFEDDITGQAINRDVELITKPCGSCMKDSYNRYAWELRNRYFEMNPVSFDSQYLNGTSLPDMEGVAYTTNNNWGLNLAITATCDLTDFFIENKNTFTRLLWKQVACDVLRLAAYNTRMDGSAQALRKEAYLALKGEPSLPYPNGVEHELEKEYTAINLSVDDLDTPCLSKKNKGITIRAI
jgi:hypothetical protein